MKNIILGMRLETPDHQRGNQLLDIYDTTNEEGFVKSCTLYNYEYKILRQDISTMYVGYNLGQNKMLIFRDYLKRHRNEYDKVLLSDVFDVVILKPNLFEFMENDILYIGDETGTLDVNWVRQNSKALLKYDMFNQWYQSNKNKVMLNTGLIGGNIDLVIHLLDKICDIILKYCKNYDEGNDMFILNYICYSAINSGELKIIHGHPFNTKFKQYEHNNKECYLAHK